MALPRSLAWRACWLNSYRPQEVACWLALGVNGWRELSLHPPEDLSWAVHAQRRWHWPQQCLESLHLLKDKAALLDFTPEPWRPPFLVLDSSSQEVPPWWWSALEGQGIVLKPQKGHGGWSVIRFRSTSSGLTHQALFRPLPSGTVLPAPPTWPEPKHLLAYWQRLCRSGEPALAAPYLTHSRQLPFTDPSVVVRVITAHPAPDAPIAVRLAWLEVPLAQEVVAFLTPTGRRLPKPPCGPLTPAQHKEVACWEEQLKAGTPPCVLACLEAAVRLHALLPPMDEVAWDWIPADPHPLLLEGNGGFGLMIPQLFERLNLVSISNP